MRRASPLYWNYFCLHMSLTEDIIQTVTDQLLRVWKSFNSVPTISYQTCLEERGNAATPDVYKTRESSLQIGSIYSTSWCVCPKRGLCNWWCPAVYIAENEPYFSCCEKARVKAGVWATGSQETSEESNTLVTRARRPGWRDMRQVSQVETGERSSSLICPKIGEKRQKKIR